MARLAGEGVNYVAARRARCGNTVLLSLPQPPRSPEPRQLAIEGHELQIVARIVRMNESIEQTGLRLGRAMRYGRCQYRTRNP